MNMTEVSRDETEVLECILSKQMVVSFGTSVTLEATDYKDPQIICFPYKKDKFYVAEE